MTNSDHLNNLLIAKLESIDVMKLQSKEMLTSYREYSLDYKFEEATNKHDLDKERSILDPDGTKAKGRARNAKS